MKMNGIPWVLVLATAWFSHVFGQTAPPEYIVEERVRAGDFASLDAIANKEGLGTLYSLLSLAQSLQFGDKSREVETEIVRRIATIDDHARMIGDRIESLSSVLSKRDSVSRLFGLLALVGTPDDIAQIGRFMDDPRNPEVTKDGRYDPIMVGSPNNHYAARALLTALGDKIPVPRTEYFYEEDRKRVHEWWHSPAAEEYRKLTAAAVGEVSAVKAPQAAPPVAKVVTPVEAPKTQMRWWVLVGAIVLGLAMWLVARSRKR